MGCGMGRSFLSSSFFFLCFGGGGIGEDGNRWVVGWVGPPVSSSFFLFFLCELGGGRIGEHGQGRRWRLEEKNPHAF